jgi:hypothetical protein
MNQLNIGNKLKGIFNFNSFDKKCSQAGVFFFTSDNPEEFSTFCFQKIFMPKEYPDFHEKRSSYITFWAIQIF